MIGRDESNYHSRREAECQAMARTAAAPGIAAIHARLALLHAEAKANAAAELVVNYGAGATWWWPRRRSPWISEARAEELAAA